MLRETRVTGKHWRRIRRTHEFPMNRNRAGESQSRAWITPSFITFSKTSGAFHLSLVLVFPLSPVSFVKREGRFRSTRQTKIGWDCVRRFPSGVLCTFWLLFLSNSRVERPPGRRKNTGRCICLSFAFVKSCPRLTAGSLNLYACLIIFNGLPTVPISFGLLCWSSYR